MDPQNNQNNTQNVNQSSAQTPPASVHNNTLMAVLAYLGILVVISYIFAKDNSFVKFHIKQGLVLLVIEIATYILGSMMGGLWFILNLVNLVVFVLAIIGIVNAVQGKQKELPLVGSFANKFKI